MYSHIKDWLEDLSHRELSDLDSEDYWQGWEDGQTVLAHRILAVLERLEDEESE